MEHVEFIDGEVKSIDKSFRGYLNFPNQINDQDIVSIASDACQNGLITGIDLSKTSIKIINSYAFCYCHFLESVVFPESLETIKNNAFAHCKISSIFIPKKLINFDGWAFNQANNLNSINVDEENPSFVSLNNFIITKDLTTVVLAPKNASYECIPNISLITKIATTAFLASQIRYWKVTRNISILGSFAFSGSKIKYADLRETSLKGIPDSCFRDCNKLVELHLPDSISSITDNAFTKTAIKCIALPPLITSIANNAFTSCQNLRVVTYFGNNDFSSSTFFENIIIEPKVYVTSSYPSEKFSGIIVREGAYQYGMMKEKCSLRVEKQRISLILLFFSLIFCQ